MTYESSTKDLYDTKTRSHEGFGLTEKETECKVNGTRDLIAPVLSLTGQDGWNGHSLNALRILYS